jgi:hypothetical protein
MLLYHQRGVTLMAQAIDKQKAHDLIDRMPPDQIPVAVSLLESMLQSTTDDEPVTEEDLRRFREVKAALSRGENGTPMEEVLAEFGLKMDDFPLKK